MATEDYTAFLERKAIIDSPTGIPSPEPLNSALFDFQRAAVEWALKRGRAALFEGTGLGKTPQQCEWSRVVENYTKMPVLIVAPLAVAHQTIDEAKKILGMDIRFAESGDDVGDRGVYITNYQKLDRFDPAAFGGVALDESSIIKSVDGKTKDKLMEMFASTPFRLACTATPAPNDYMELGNHAEFLGVMSSTEMLATFFVHDGGETQKWRLKGHAEQDFWKWLASWSLCIQSPADIGFDGSAYVLPKLRMHEVIVDCEGTVLPGDLFAMPARTLQERRGARGATIEQRAAKCVEIVGDSQEQWLIWCNLNTESKHATKVLNALEVTGSDSDESKTASLLGFAAGKIPRMVSKVSIAGFGLNLQSCHKMIFLGLSDSYEQLYQAIRRCWRFGQTQDVDVYIVISSLEGEVLRNIKRKEADAEAMTRALVEHMADFTKRELKAITRTKLDYKPEQKVSLPSWLK